MANDCMKCDGFWSWVLSIRLTLCSFGAHRWKLGEGDYGHYHVCARCGENGIYIC